MACLSLACCHSVIIVCSTLVWTLCSCGICQELMIPISHYSCAVYKSCQGPGLTRGRIANSVLLSKVNDEERRAEQRKYGVFFDDDYDYLQHLKEPSGPAELIPSTTFATPLCDKTEDPCVYSVSFRSPFTCETLQQWGDSSFLSQ